MSSVVDSVRFANIGPGNTAAFRLKGGRYNVLSKSSGAGTIDVTMLGADGTTFVKVITTIATTTGVATIDLPPGQFRVEIGGFTANFVSITGVPA